MAVLGCISQDAPEITKESRHGTERRNRWETENSIVIQQLFIFYGLSACLQSGNKQVLSKQGNFLPSFNSTCPKNLLRSGLVLQRSGQVSRPHMQRPARSEKGEKSITDRHGSHHKQLMHLLLFLNPTQRLGGKSWDDWANTSHAYSLLPQALISCEQTQKRAKLEHVCANPTCTVALSYSKEAFPLASVACLPDQWQMKLAPVDGYSVKWQVPSMKFPVMASPPTSWVHFQAV